LPMYVYDLAYRGKYHNYRWLSMKIFEFFDYVKPPLPWNGPSE